jgi:hypothetical protein
VSSPPGNDLFQSSPIDFPVSGTTDAVGNLVLNNIIRSAYWITAKLVGQASGAPRWTLSKGNNTIPLDYGQGSNVSIGPFVLGPNQPLKIQVSGALPNTAVTGMITGIQSPDGGSAVDHFSPQTSAQFIQPVPLITLTADGNFHSMVNVPIPAGTHSIVLDSAIFSNQASLDSIQITGHVTGINYVLETSSPVAGQALFGDSTTFGFLFSSWDTSLDITWQINIAGAPIYVSGDMDPTVIDTTPGAFVASGLESRDGRLDISSYYAGTTNATGSSGFTTGGVNPVFSAGGPYYNGMLATSFGSRPAPWQAASSFINFETAVNAGATTTVIAAPGGTKVIYLHSIWVWILSRPANSKLVFRDSVGPTSLAHLPEIAGVLGPWNLDLKGVPLASSSSALQLNNPGAANSDFAIGTITYSIA